MKEFHTKLENEIIAKLYNAIKQGDMEVVKVIVSEEAKYIDLITPTGTWLHVAASLGNLEAVKYFIELGVDVNKNSGIFQGGALNEAALKAHYDIVKYLLDCGADLDVSKPERNPLFGAIYCGNIDIIKLLIERGIDTTVRYTEKSMYQMDALAYATERGRKEIVEVLRNSNK